MKFSVLSFLVSTGLIKDRQDSKDAKSNKYNKPENPKEFDRWDNSQLPRIRYPR